MTGTRPSRTRPRAALSALAAIVLLVQAILAGGTVTAFAGPGGGTGLGPICHAGHPDAPPAGEPVRPPGADHPCCDLCALGAPVILATAPVSWRGATVLRVGPVAAHRPAPLGALRMRLPRQSRAPPAA